MTRWVAKVDIKGPLYAAQRGEITFEDSRDQIVSILKSRAITKNFAYINDLEQAQDADEFDEFLDALYDFADSRRIWLGPA